MSKELLTTRPCGAVHPKDGEVCMITVYTEPALCSCGTPRVYDHDGPHETFKHGIITPRWEQVLVVKDLPFDGYRPHE